MCGYPILSWDWTWQLNDDAYKQIVNQCFSVCPHSYLKWPKSTILPIPATKHYSSIVFGIIHWLSGVFRYSIQYNSIQFQNSVLPYSYIIHIKQISENCWQTETVREKPWWIKLLQRRERYKNNLFVPFFKWSV